MRPLSVAALQAAPEPGDPTATLERFAARVRQIRRTWPGVQLVVAPEQYLSAPPPLLEESEEAVLGSAVDVPGPLTRRLGSLARETGLWLVPGTVYERADGGGVHNTALAFSPGGELVAAYRKIFPWQPVELSRPGRTFSCFDIPGLARIGLAICYDGAFPEVGRQLAWMGAEVVIQPTLTSTVDREAEIVLSRANAIANQFYVVNLNGSAPAGVGRSVIVDPEGTVRVETGSSDVVITDVLDLDAVTRVRRHGAYGLNRLWEQLSRRGPDIPLPAYGGRFVPPPGDGGAWTPGPVEGVDRDGDGLARR
ncbi:carbon-nitrogen hydrolase family protein [Actinomadura chibensis]|uniref:Carbon-nitrogen hydrolase family protein n=1 Tax=Actinomadura chibensis TaxID=392828 RepID=A0A5D0NCA4_9ACTN|nr:carbon-nitrogen hydrolase family protein [Actinomadura chibensis]TYB41825.1 carbon-nitrogen hydrolase family protein [Actinomadura chibensis]